MRRLSFATLIVAVSSLSFLGCRQTAGPTAGGSMSSGSMSPAMQSPSFNPFGGSTRVTPPPPNTAVAPNPYIGGPPGQTNAVQGTAAGFASAAPGVVAPANSGQVIGSGIQPAGFVGTGVTPTAQAGFTSSDPSGVVAPTSYGATAPATVNPFRAGGMQVNDLTQAPAPPGYQPPAGYQPSPPNDPAPIMTTPGQFGTAPTPPGFVPTSAPITPASGGAATGVVPATNFTPIQQMPIQPAQYQQPQAWQGTPAAAVPDSEIASRMVPVNTASSSNPTTPVIQSETSPAPAGTASSTGSSDLMWRRPGS